MLPPGPKAPRALQTVAWLSRPLPFLAHAQARYGDTFTMRIGSEPRWVILSHPDAVREVFTGDPDVFHAGEGNVILRPLLGASSVLLLDGAAHLRQRRLLLPPFHGDRLQHWTDTMREIAEREVASWPQGEPVGVRARMQGVTLDIVMRVVFGAAGAEAAPLREALRRMLDRTSGPRFMALIAVLGPDLVER